MPRFNETAPAVGAYKNVLSPPTSVCDVTYWVNEQCEREGRNMAAINTAGRRFYYYSIDCSTFFPVLSFLKSVSLVVMICSGGDNSQRKDAQDASTR